MYKQEQEKNFFNFIREKSKNIKIFKEKYFFTKQKDNHENKNENHNDPKLVYETEVVPFLKRETSLVGYKIFDPNYTISFLFGLILFDGLSYLVVNIIDIWLIWGSDFENVCFCLVTWMLGFTGCTLIYVMLDKIPIFCDLLKIIYDFGDNLDKKTESEEIEKYVKHSKDCKKLYIITTLFCGGGGIICTFYPIIIYFMTGEAGLPYGFFIPGISTTENPGYLINYAYQIFQCYCTAIGTMQATFHTFLLFVSNSFFQIDNLIIKLRKLARAIEGNPNTNGHENELTKIIKLHQQFELYLSMIEEVYNIMFFVNIACYTIMNIITLFVLVNQMWFIGYYLLGVLFGLILVPCAIGTALEMKNDNLVKEIYAVPWYLLTPKERKTFLFFLTGAQATAMPSCGGFLPLNVNTFRMTYSKIYSILMFLKNVM